MSMKDVIKKSVLENFVSDDISIYRIVFAFLVTIVISAYIFQIYKIVKKSGFYSHTFNVSMSVISIITAGIILSMQSNIVISLGMVGALSIVRFRTAIKDPMDLLFLFWSIGTGIICGAGSYSIAILLALFTTIGIFSFEMMPKRKGPLLLVINTNKKEAEREILSIIHSDTKKYVEKSRNITKTGVDYVFEIICDDRNGLVNRIAEMEEVINVSLMAHDGEVRA